MLVRRNHFLALLVLVVVAMAVPACGGTGVETPADKDVETASEETAAAVETEEAETVTATLKYFDENVGRGGAKGAVPKTMEVPYLPSGLKIATMETTKGVVKIKLWEDRAPNTVVNFVYIANAGRYDGVDFHRVIDGFMAQTGDVEMKNGMGGPGYTIPAEFDPELKHVRGVVSMARAQPPDSGGSQFFIMFASAASLDGSYAAFGEVIEGMDVIDSLKKGSRANNGAVSDPDKIVRLRVESVPAE